MNEIIEKESVEIENMIYEIRGVEVMLDSDLAKLYHVETKRINEAVKNNPNKFPEMYLFRLSEYEYQSLMSKISTSKGGSKKGHTAFTEQGVYMLATILKSKEATEISIIIMDTFVKMRHYINYNKVFLPHRFMLLEDKVNNNTKRIDELFDKFNPKDIAKNSIFFENDFYDAYSLLLDVLGQAKQEIIIIDNYAGKELLDILKKLDKKIVIVSKNINKKYIFDVYSKGYSSYMYFFDNFYLIYYNIELVGVISMIPGEILEELLFISRKGKFISEKTILEIIESIIKQCDYITRNSYSETKFEPLKWKNAMACVQPEDGIISVDYEKIKQYEHSVSKKSMICQNLEVVQIISHEIEHLKEKSKLVYDNYESRLIRISDTSVIFDAFWESMDKKYKYKSDEVLDDAFKKYYNGIYNINPAERIADSLSFKSLLDSIEKYPNFKTDYPREYKYIKDEYYKCIKRGYKIKNQQVINFPLYDYLQKLGILDFLCYFGINVNENGKIKEIRDNKSIDLDTKLIYGFPVKYKKLQKNK